MSSVVNWVKRNRRKLAVGGVVVGGLYLVGKVAETQYLKYREEENRKLLEKLRKDNQFSSTEHTCVATLSSLFPVLRHVIESNLDTETITTLLRENRNMSTEEKMTHWTQLKVISVSRCLVLVIGGVYLSVMLRVQLNILAGYLYQQQQQQSNHNNNIKNGSLSKDVQENFVSICHNFVSSGNFYYQ